MFDKPFFTRINEFADWIIRLVVLNILMIFFSLGIVTVFPAISAGYNMFNDYVNKKNPRLFVDFFAYFKEDLGRKIAYGAVLILGFFIAFLNIRYYNASLKLTPTTFLWIGYYVSLGLTGIWLAIMLFSLIVIRVKSDLNPWQHIKLSFMLAGRFYWITLILVVITFSPFLLILFPNSYTSFLFVFFGLSIPMFLNVILTRRVVRYLEGIGKVND